MTPNKNCIPLVFTPNPENTKKKHEKKRLLASRNRTSIKSDAKICLRSEDTFKNVLIQQRSSRLIKLCSSQKFTTSNIYQGQYLLIPSIDWFYFAHGKIHFLLSLSDLERLFFRIFYQRMWHIGAAWPALLLRQTTGRTHSQMFISAFVSNGLQTVTWRKMR